MSDLIPPLTPPSTTPPVADKVISGIIENPPSMLIALKNGDSLLLKALMESDALSFKAGTTLNLGSNRQEFPLTIKLDTPLKLPHSEPTDVLIKIGNSTADNLSFKITSINNQPPSRYAGADKLIQSSSLPNLAIIKDTSGNSPQLPLLPIKVAPMLEQILNSTSLSPALKAEVVQAFSATSIKVVLDSILPNSQSPSATQSSFQAPAALGEFNASINTIVKEATQHPPLSASALIDAIKNKLPLLDNLLLPARVEIPSGADKPLLILKSLLGNILPELPLKLNVGTDVLLQLKELFKLPQPSSSHGIGSKNEAFQHITEPFRNTIFEPLSAKIMERLPTPNKQMLSSMLNYIKSTQTHDISAWLGNDLLAELKSTGPAGNEVINRLSEFMNSGTREGVSWRIVEIPLFNGDNISKIKIAVKKNSEEDEEDNTPSSPKKGGTRFMVDTSFSRLGEFQFDGFSLAQDRRFDLVVRTSREVPEDLYAAFIRIFKNSLHEVSYIGNININVKENFIKICDDEINSPHLKNGVFI